MNTLGFCFVSAASTYSERKVQCSRSEQNEMRCAMLLLCVIVWSLNENENEAK